MYQPVRARTDTFRLAVIGDLHTHWDEVDLAHFAGSDYDLLYFTGDLGGGTADSSLRVARSMAALRRPTLVMPGNNDTGDINALAAELAHQNGLNQLMSIATAAKGASDPIMLCGYSHHLIHAGELDISLIAGRPHSMGGPNLSFPEYMADTYQIDSLETSRQKLFEIVEQADAEHLIFLAHNGPFGLGEQPHDMWGCDFKGDGGDWGDPDLAEAIAHARRLGKTVLAVVAGHMHLRTRQGCERPWKMDIDGILYINAARVPRIFSGEDDVYRHHVSVTISPAGIYAEEILVAQYGGS
jgi:uncharacterized protein (TIGR04168 family)